MLVTLLLTVTSPGITLGPNVDRHVRLVEFEKPEELGPMSRQDLGAELLRLEDSRPNIIGPIALLAAGGAVAVGGAGDLLYALIASLLKIGGTSTFSTVATYVSVGLGIAAVATGATLAIVGGVLLASRWSKRKKIDAQISEVTRRLEGRPPPDTYLFSPGATFVLARF